MLSKVKGIVMTVTSGTELQKLETIESGNRQN